MMTHIGRYYGFDKAIWVFVGQIYFAHTLFCCNEFGYYTVNGMVMMWTIHVLATSVFSHKLERIDFHWVSEENKSNDERRERAVFNPSPMG